MAESNKIQAKEKLKTRKGNSEERESGDEENDQRPGESGNGFKDRGRSSRKPGAVGYLRK